MAIDKAKVKFVYTTSTAYVNTIIDPNTLYFIADTQQIFLGSVEYSPKPDQATDNVSGTIKVNSAQGISLSADGQLQIEGLMAEMNGGIYYPADKVIKSLGKNSILVTEGANSSLGSKSLAVITGMNISLRATAEAGTTQYEVTNTYAGRFTANLAIGGVACLDENDADNTVSITSVKHKSGANVVVGSDADNTSDPIVITTSKSVNPSASTKQIRVYPIALGFSSIFAGIAGNQNSGYGYSAVIGQRTYNSSNGSAVFGIDGYNIGNASLVAGRQNINKKQNAVLIGQGHNTTDGADSVACLGKWSNITSDTIFAVGDGTSATKRSNAFEVLDSGGIVIKSPNGSKWKISVDDSGNLVTASV